MKVKFVLTSILFVVGFFSTGYSQASIEGKAVEIVDGQTFVLEDAKSARFFVKPQYVEVPVSDPGFAPIAKDHLSTLLLGKSIRLDLKKIEGTNNVGRVVANGVDISMQMVRDGVAWYDNSYQEREELSRYTELQDLAKNEKRGIWALNLQPSWEAAAAKQAQEKAAKQAEDDASLEKRENSRPKAKGGLYNALPGGSSLAGSPTSYYDKFSDVTTRSTNFVTFANNVNDAELSFALEHKFPGTDVDGARNQGTYTLKIRGKGILVFFHYATKLQILSGQERMSFTCDYNYIVGHEDFGTADEKEIEEVGFKLTPAEFNRLRSMPSFEMNLGGYVTSMGESYMGNFRDLP